MSKKPKPVCPACGGGLQKSEPIDFGDCVNVDWTCPTHGKQYTISTRKDL